MELQPCYLCEGTDAEVIAATGLDQPMRYLAHCPDCGALAVEVVQPESGLRAYSTHMEAVEAWNAMEPSRRAGRELQGRLEVVRPVICD